MDAGLLLAPASTVRARIARLLLEERPPATTLGTISLQPHQISAVARLEIALDEFGGALLSDDVGMGKTFVATAIARRFERCLVVTPAALAGMWREALALTGAHADLVTFEKLSRSDAHSLNEHLQPRYGLVVIDEAHHARNPATRRHRCLASLVRDSRVLLLTATPIHNRKSELLSLLSLFLGSRASAMTESEISRCIVRREHRHLERSVNIPAILPVVLRDVPDDPRIAQELMRLPPPLPPRDGGDGGALIARGLLHQWASSQAALREAIRRRRAKAAAMIVSLKAGAYPTAVELATWIYAEGALQLGFAELLAAPMENTSTLLQSVMAHSDALETLHAKHLSSSDIDLERAHILDSIRNRHPRAKIVAFAQYAETVAMLFHHLAPRGRVAMLTAGGARVAGGRLGREEALSRFAPRACRARSPAPGEEIDLLLATDLLSEGVNLQDAEVVVHLDIPWTAARMEQRVGRVARMGSVHSTTTVYLLRPPATAAWILGNEAIIQHKWDLAARMVGSSSIPPFEDRPPPNDGESRRSPSVPDQTERLRSVLTSWLRDPATSPLSGEHEAADSAPPVGSGAMLAGCVASRERGFIAAVSIGGQRLLIANISGDISTALKSQIKACALGAGDDISTCSSDFDKAIVATRNWSDRHRARLLVGASVSSVLRRRLLNRIDAAIHSAPPHLREARSLAAARAREIATCSHGSAVERELESLQRSSLPDDEWLRAIAAVGPGHRPNRRNPEGSRAADLQIHALLLFKPQ